MTTAPLLEAMVAPENSLLVPSGDKVRGEMRHRSGNSDKACGFTFSEDSVQSINGVFVAKQQTEVFYFPVSTKHLGKGHSKFIEKFI